MLRKCRALFVLFLGSAGIAFGQGPVGTLSGTITDPAGSVVPGATVIATNTATGVETTTTSTNTQALTTFPICRPLHTNCASRLPDPDGNGGEYRAPRSADTDRGHQAGGRRYY